jgi:hypothetical protein
MAGLTQLRATNFWKKLESLSTFEPFPTLKVFRFHVPSLQVHGSGGDTFEPARHTCGQREGERANNGSDSFREALCEALTEVV